MGELSPLIFSVNIDGYVVIPAILLFKDLIACSRINATVCLLVFSSPVV
jgi:hypothetical protein